MYVCSILSTYNCGFLSLSLRICTLIKYAVTKYYKYKLQVLQVEAVYQLPTCFIFVRFIIKNKMACHGLLIWNTLLKCSELNAVTFYSPL